MIKFNTNILNSAGTPYTTTSMYDLYEALQLVCPAEVYVVPRGAEEVDQNHLNSIKTTVRIVALPEGFSTIPNEAFSGCTSLGIVVMPDSITSIGIRAFQNTSLRSIYIPDSVTSIGSSAFRGCTSLTNISVPFVGESVDNSANFGYFFGIDNTSDSTSFPGDNGEIIVYDNSIRNVKKVEVRGGDIVEAAFKQCSDLKEAVITDKVSSISSNAFEDCGSLTSITIPDSVTSIGGYAFKNCSSLTSVTIPDSVTSIGAGAFQDCTSLIDVTIPFVGDGSSNTHFGYIFGANSYSFNNDWVPSSLKTVVITGGDGIDERAFYECSSLMGVTLPNSATSIGKAAFLGCTKLISVTVPDSVTSIGDYAFNNCKRLTSITIPNGVESIGYSAFYNCESLIGVTVPDSVTSIRSYAFYNCDSLTSITIPDSVTSIGSNAFYDCDSLTSVTIGNSVTSIGNYAFYDCTSLKNAEVKSTKISDIGASAFANCSLLTNIGDFINEKTLTHVGAGAFTDTAYYKNNSNWLYGGSTYNVTNPSTISKNKGDTLIVGNWLLAVVAQNIYKSDYDYQPTKASNWSLDNIDEAQLPKTLHIADNAFAGLDNLYTITLPGSHHIHYDWHRCDESAVLNTIYSNNGYCTIEVSGNYDPETGIETPVYCEGPFAPCECLSVGKEAFKNCYNLESIYIPTYVQSIGQNAFDECGLRYDIYRRTECLCGPNGEWCGAYVYEEIDQEIDHQTIVYYANTVERWESITDGMGISEYVKGSDAKPDMSPDNNGTNWVLATISGSPDGDINTNVYNMTLT